MNQILLLISAIILLGCGRKTSHQSTQLTTAMFRGDPQHSGVYATEAVHHFKAIKWAHQTNGPARSSPAVTNGVVYFTSRDGCLYGVEAQSGKPLLKFQTGEPLPYNWFKFGIDEQIRDYFVREGYEKLDAKALAQFMKGGIANKTPSVVVFAALRVPATVIDDSSEAALLRQYLNAGGKVVFLGAPPLIYQRDPKTDQVIALDFTIPERIIGVRYTGNSAIGVGGWYQSTVTAEGVKWGLLRDWWIGGFAVDASQVTTVLARDETGGASAWVKNYGGPEGTGLVQLWHKRDGQEDLIAVKAVAEYGLR